MPMTSRGGHGNAGVSLIPPPTPAPHRSQDGAESGTHPRVVVGGASIPSTGKGTGNQDTFVSASSGSKCFVGVFDGHGEKGDRVSHFARDVLSKSLFDHEELHTNPRSALEHAYKEAQRQIEKKVAPDAAESGTTAVAAYQHRDRLFVANVGDSRAVLGRCDSSRGSAWDAVDLSRDHKPGRADERQRIVAAGGKVDQGCFPIPQGGSIKWLRAGPERVMDKHGMGGLAVSRSLGDLNMRPYVSSKPEVVERKLDSKDKFIVLASDGIWDQVSSKEAVDIVGKNISDPNTAAREIASVARKRWQAQTAGQLWDDITAVVVRLDSSGRSAPSTPGRHRAERGRAPQEMGSGVGQSAPRSPMAGYQRSRTVSGGMNGQTWNSEYTGPLKSGSSPSSPSKGRRDAGGLSPKSPGGSRHNSASMMGTLDGRTMAALDSDGRRPRTQGLVRSQSEASPLSGHGRPITVPGRGRREEVAAGRSGFGSRR